MTRQATLTTVEDLLAEAQAGLDRLTPAEAHAAAQTGDLLIDIRPVEQRRRDGLVPGAAIVDRNVLEWRLDPGGAHRDPTLARTDRRVILLRFGLDATDVIDGVQGWLAAGLPLHRPTA